ncbi:MAG: DUF2635 domain-containing protein [Rhizobiales bacterium]|nr:DUF2635 domain-containing protein [Hyphomicrobiales bacterium]NRB13103.1 DUF2635 domain-containing protein [Hyphomicrobiales bacterium]
MFIKPCAGRAVRDPETSQLLHENGQNKPDTPYWQKRLIAGDVIKIKSPKSKKETKS